MTKFSNTKNVVLYADDDPDDLRLLQDAFAQYSDRVELVTVKDGMEAISYLNSLSEYDLTPCLIILDVNMPRMNGKETLYTIRKTEGFEQVPVVLFTTSSQPLDSKFAAKHKAGFITKPIDYKQMDIIANEFLKHCTEQSKKNISKQAN